MVVRKCCRKPGLFPVELFPFYFFLSNSAVKLNGGRHVQGILRGFDPFMNLVVDDCVEMSAGGQMNTIGMVVSKVDPPPPLLFC